MSDTSENPQKKANLIKQARPVNPQPEPEPESAAHRADAGGERRKVVIVKKKVVVPRKPQTRVVAHHADPSRQDAGVEEQSAAESQSVSSEESQQPVQTPLSPVVETAAPLQAGVPEVAEPSAQVSESVPSPSSSAQAQVPHEESAARAPAQQARGPLPSGQPARTPYGTGNRPSSSPTRPQTGVPRPAPGGQAPSSSQRPGMPPGTGREPVQPQGSSSSPQSPRPSNPVWQGGSYRGGPRPPAPPQSDNPYQSQRPFPQRGAYNPQAPRPGQPPAPGGYQGESGGGGQGGYGSRPPYPGQGSGGYGSQGSYGGQGGYGGQSGQGGYGSRPPYPGQGGGGQGGYGSRPPYPGQGGGGQGGYGSRPPYPGQGGGGYGGQGGYGAPRPGAPAGSGGYGSRPGYGGQGGYGAPRPGAPRPGGYSGPGGRPGMPPRPGAPGAPVGSGKSAIRKPAPKRKPAFSKRDEEAEKELQQKKKAEARAMAIPRAIDIMENISVSDLARKMNIKPAELIGKLMTLGVMATINQKIDSETATLLASEYGCAVNIVSLYDETVIEKAEDMPTDMAPRPPIVTVMGHVDHGKTKLLDAIRKTNVVASEFGGITQHIGAYQVETARGKITFLDTPGHEAFTKMRARGSKVTDIVVLVVAANDGVMPQTREAIDHAKAADVPIIVAINKIDLPEANPDRVKTQLSEIGLIPEEWGGQTIFCEISALQKKGIAELLESILLQAEVLELTANFDRFAEAKIIESRIDQGRGIVSTVIVERGTLHVGDPFVAGIYPGKVRALFDDKGQRVNEAGPSMPVEVLGFEGIPDSGDPFEVVEDEKFARAISDKRQELKKYEEARNVKKVTLDNLYDTIHEGEVQELKVIIKGDVHGSVEALKGLLEKLSTVEVRLNVIRASAGAITEDDVNLASASDAIIIAFNVRPSARAKALADQLKVEIRKYNIIYRAQEDIQKAMEGMLAPELKEREIGKVEVRDIFKVPKVGIVAGCFVLEGSVRRNCQVRVIRESVEIFHGKITSLKRFKDDAREVATGYECGIGIENCNDLQAGDTLEIYETVEVARTLTPVEDDERKKTENA